MPRAPILDPSKRPPFKLEWRRGMSTQKEHPMIRHFDTSFHEQMLQVELEIQEDIFKTISLHIHDNIGQQLSLSKLFLNSLKQAEAGETQQQIINIKKVITNCISDLRELAGMFSRKTIHNIGLVEILRKQVSLIRKTGQLRVKLDVQDDMPEPGKNASMVLFRMIQECLFKVLNDALATKVEIKIYIQDDQWCTEITDNRKNKMSQYMHVPLSLQKKAKLITAKVYASCEKNQISSLKICVPFKGNAYDQNSIGR